MFAQKKDKQNSVTGWAVTIEHSVARLMLRAHRATRRPITIGATAMVAHRNHAAVVGVSTLVGLGMPRASGNIHHSTPIRKPNGTPARKPHQGLTGGSGDIWRSSSLSGGIWLGELGFIVAT
jgi:hypothetical protein